MVWKKIVKREVFSDERFSISRRTLNYKRVDWVRLYLECGHVKTVRDYGSPEKRVKCKDCDVATATPP